MTTRVLIVENDALHLRLYDALLSSGGYHTSTARNREDALASVRVQRPDLVLMDVDLDEPGGDAAEAFRRDGDLGAVPVVALSAYALRSMTRRLGNSGRPDCMSGTMSMNAVLDAVGQSAQT